MNSKAIGERTEAQVLAALLKKGLTVLIPFGDNQRYDLVIDENGKFTRIQCKTGRLKKGAIAFNTCSIDVNTQKRKSYYGEADLFGIYCPETDKCYLIPVRDCGKRETKLRVLPAKNNNKINIRLASDYEIKEEITHP